jgi:biotin carboxyl carrier protein
MQALPSTELRTRVRRRTNDPPKQRIAGANDGRGKPNSPLRLSAHYENLDAIAMDEPDFLRAVTAAPHDHELVRRYAAHLLKRGDPRGRLLHLEMARRRVEKNLAQLKSRIERISIFERLDSYWLDQILPLQVVAPVDGTFYTAPNPFSPPFIQVGRRCRPGTVVCVVESMKVFYEIPAEVDGIVAEILVQNGEPVDCGRPLFRVHRMPEFLAGR